MIPRVVAQLNPLTDIFRINRASMRIKPIRAVHGPQDLRSQRPAPETRNRMPKARANRLEAVAAIQPPAASRRSAHHVRSPPGGRRERFIELGTVYPWIGVPARRIPISRNRRGGDAILFHDPIRRAPPPAARPLGRRTA